MYLESPTTIPIQYNTYMGSDKEQAVFPSETANGKAIS